MIHGLLIFLVFAIFAALMYRRIVPALLAVPCMAILMTVVAGVPSAQLAGSLGSVIVDGASALSKVYVAVIFGALLGRVTLDSGIARTIVNFAAEFAGDEPAVVALILCAVVALLFVSLSGLGAIIMVGSIVLPIMMTTSVPRKIAATLFLMAFALGFIFNIVNWQFYTKYFGVSQQQMYQYAVILAVIDLVALLTYAFISFRTTRGYATWAVKLKDEPISRVPAWSLITPILPIVLYFAFHMEPIVAFAVSAIYGVLTTRPARAIESLASAAIRGFEDVAPAVLLFIGIGMLLTATKLPQFGLALQPIVSGGWLRNPIAFIVLFGLLSPLVLYRGPLNPFGVGIAVFTVLLTAHIFPPVILVAAMMAVVQVQNVCDPTNTANVWVGNYTGVHIEEITKRTLPYQVAVATAATLVIVAFAPKLFGKPFVFAPLAAPVQAAEAFPGLFARADAAMHVAVGTDGSAEANGASQTLLSAINGWPYMYASRSSDDPNSDDCSKKNYAAFVRVTASTFAARSGNDVDIGAELSDCAGWIVDEWHEHQKSPRPLSDLDLGRLGAALATRMRTWMASHPALAQNLLAKGLAYDPAHPQPTFFYSLYKTVDGYMRAYVRPGGPAYVAGMRSGDVVDKLDDRFWWEYGTYQTQLRAYDGKPHAFDITRNGESYHVQLGQPFE